MMTYMLYDCLIWCCLTFGLVSLPGVAFLLRIPRASRSMLGQVYAEVCWALCWLHVAPCGLMLRPSWLHVGSSWVKVGRVGSMLAQDASKLAPRWLKMAICWLNLASRRPKWLPESSKMPQKCLGKASRWGKNRDFWGLSSKNTKMHLELL